MYAHKNHIIPHVINVFVLRALFFVSDSLAGHSSRRIRTLNFI